jgi:hypothetical protein
MPGSRVISKIVNPTEKGWPHASPSRWWIPFSFSWVRLFFLFSLSWSSGVSLLPTSWVVELLFPLIRSGGGWPSLAFLGYGGLLFVFLCYFFRFGRIVHLKMSSMREWPIQRVVDGMIFGKFFSHFFSLILEAKSTLLRRILVDTRPQPRSPPSSAPAAANSGRVNRRW